MIKKIFTILIIAFAVFIFTNTANAAGKAAIYFEPASKMMKAGENFNINVMVDPRGEKVDTIRAIVNFPVDKLAAEYFDLSENYSLQSPGSYIDNKKGIINQGGAMLASQASTKSVFGTITFKAKSDGIANITLTNDSKAISSGVEKINLAGLGKAVITISKAGEEIKKEKWVSVESAIHENQEKWYNINTVNISWRAEGGEATSYYYAFDQDPETNPSLQLNKNEISKTFENVADGVWYFHIRTQYNDKTFSDTNHYRVMIDTADPQKIQPIFENAMIFEGETAELIFSTTDQVSGIDYYEVAMDGGEFFKQDSPYLIKDLSIGEHIANVRAYDKAGNLTANIAKINITEKPVAEKTPTNWKKIGTWGGVIVVVVLFLWLLIKKKKREG
ncbi:MAG: cohesin domain-containing protein [Patescibacteria group bacterium]|nr:cohesin domain-containing protein [Patescibacteria group bacterium]